MIWLWKFIDNIKLLIVKVIDDNLLEYYRLLEKIFNLSMDVEEVFVIELKNVIIDFGEILVVDNVSFKIFNGKLVMFLGLFGSGKIIILNVISGLLIIISGNVYFNGKDVISLLL